MCVVKLWRPVAGFESGYQVSSHGDVYSNHSRRYLKPHIGSNGYQELTLRKDGRSYLRRVHSLVAEAFLGPRPAGHHVCHADDIGVNNCLANLRYGTPKENAADLRRNKGHYHSRQTHCVHGHAFTSENTYWRTNGARDCRECRRAWRRKNKKKRREQALALLASAELEGDT